MDGVTGSGADIARLPLLDAHPLASRHYGRTPIQYARTDVTVAI